MGTFGVDGFNDVGVWVQIVAFEVGVSQDCVGICVLGFCFARWVFVLVILWFDCGLLLLRAEVC